MCVHPVRSTRRFIQARIASVFAGKSRTIETPAPGTLVGSPAVITGRTSRLPKNSALSYRVLVSAGRQLGANTFLVSGGPGQPGSFNVSATFGLPRDGGAIRVELFEPGPAPGTPLASSAIDLAVDAQYQAITIETPPPGTVVCSPLVLTGQTARSPQVQVHAWPAASDPCLQVADYCCWAIGRKWERGDTRSYDLIATKIQSEFDLFRRGAARHY